MRRLIVATTALASLAALTPVTAAPPPRPLRVVTEEYQTPAPLAIVNYPGGGGICNYGGVAGGHRGCVPLLQETRKERKLRVVIEDASGLPVRGFIQWGEENIDRWVPFCGRSPKVPIQYAEIYVWVMAYNPPGLPACNGVATTGEVEASFFRR